jgi:hypothetical protein
MNLLFSAIILVFSIAVYSVLRYFDVRTTRTLAEQLDFEKHEMNPLMVRLAKRYGVDRAFRMTWILFASAIGIGDVILNNLIPIGVPVFAYIFGSTHLLAAANNIEVAYTLNHSTKDEVEKRTMELAAELRSLSWGGRIKLVMERNAFTFVTAVFSLLIITDLYYAAPIAKVTGLSFLAVTMPIAGTIVLISLLLYFPSVALGLILMSNRLARLGGNPPPAKAEGLELDVTVVERALQIAKLNGSKTIVLQVQEG